MFVHLLTTFASVQETLKLIIIRITCWACGFSEQTSRFREFWDEANRNRDILGVIPGKRMRNVVVPASVIFGEYICTVTRLLGFRKRGLDFWVCNMRHT